MAGFIFWFLFACFMLFCVYLWLIAPNIMKRKNDFSALRGYDYAHRGLFTKTSEAPENTLPAFKRAAERGYGIELDVRLTRDKKVVVSHDDSLERACGENVRISLLTLKELRELKLFGSEETVPTLDEVLDAVGGRVPIIVELKTDGCDAELAPLVWGRMEHYQGAWCMESFDPRAVMWFRRNAPQVIRGQLAYSPRGEEKSGKWYRDFAMAAMLGNFLSRPDFIAYGVKHDKNLSRRLLRNFFGALMVAWTVTEECDFYPLKKKYDLLIFEGFDPKASDLKKEH